MLGIRVDRLLASTAIALLLAIPATGTFAGSENSADTSAAPRQEAPTGEASQSGAAGAAKPADVGTAASNSADKAVGEAKPAAASDAVQPDQPAKSAADGKPADTKPADAKPVDAKVDAKPGDAA